MSIKVALILPGKKARVGPKQGEVWDQSAQGPPRGNDQTLSLTSTADGHQGPSCLRCLLFCCSTFYLSLSTFSCSACSPSPAGWRCNWPSSCAEHCAACLRLMHVPACTSVSLHTKFKTVLWWHLDDGHRRGLLTTRFILTIIMHVVLSFSLLKLYLCLYTGGWWFEANGPSPLWLPIYL